MPRNARPLPSISELVASAGGASAVARACGINRSSVVKWERAGKLPDSDLNNRTQYAHVLIQLAGIEADVWDVRLIGRR